MGLVASAVTLAALLPLPLIWISRRLFSESPLRNIAGPPSPSFFTGHLGILLQRDSAPLHLDIPRRYGGAVKLKGFMGADVLYVTDPLALHHMVVKDSHLFPIPEFILEVSRVAWGDGIFTTEGNSHRRQRKLLTPAFNTVHLREITPIFRKVADELRATIKVATTSSPDMNILDLLSRCALELIGRGGLGASFDALDVSKPSAYNDHSKNLFPLFGRIGVISPFIPLLTKWLPASFLRLISENIPVYAIRELVVVIDYLTEWSARLLRKKRDPNSDRSHDLGEGKDIMSLLLRANDGTAAGEAMPESELLGLITQLVFAAHDTTSNSLIRILDLLTKDQDVQNRMRTEFVQALEIHGTLDYDNIQSLPYLDAVCRETLRVYPPLIYFNRNTAQDTVLPLRYPVKSADGKTDLSSIPVPKGTLVIMGFAGTNRSQDIWGDDAQEWKPDRWLKPLPASVADARVPGVYSHIMTFMGGNHSCIGFKFAELEIKVVMAMLLSNFAFFPSENGKKTAWGIGGPMFPFDPDDPDKGPQLHMRVVPLNK